MTKDLKDLDLLLKDLCGRLPYKTKIQLTEYSDLTGEKLPSKIKILDYCMLGKVQAYCKGFRKDEVKPYLLPLSSMTEEQKEELSLIACDLNDSDTWRNGNIIYSDDSYQLNELLNFYHKNHLDYRGLIPLGLAIDATGLNIY